MAASYEHRAKSLLKVSNVINNTNAPAALLVEGGLNDANRVLRDFHKQAILEANKARDVEADVINQLSGLRADLAQKIKEIKSLSGDFKNNVEKEKETTRKCVTALEEALALVDSDPTAVAGKGDPYVVRLGVERQVELAQPPPLPPGAQPVADRERGVGGVQVQGGRGHAAP